MSIRTCTQRLLWMFLVATASGCATNPGSSTTLPSSAFFSADPGERAAIQAVGRLLDTRIKSCRDLASCEEAYYARGLVALFENRADAITVFQELRTTMPGSRHAASSTRWLSLLQDSQTAASRQGALFIQLRQEVLQSLLDRDTVAASRRLTVQERHIAELRP